MFKFSKNRLTYKLFYVTGFSKLVTINLLLVLQKSALTLQSFSNSLHLNINTSLFLI